MRRVKFFIFLTFLLGLLFPARAANTNSLVWQTATDRVSADIRGEALWPLLENIARQTGWHIFVEPDTARKVDVKFSGLPSGEALKKLLGNLNFAFVPRTNEAAHLYVFLTRRENATRLVNAGLAEAAPAKPKHVPNELIVKVKPGTDIDALAKSLGAKVIGRDDKLGIYRLQFEDAAATEAALQKLKDNSAVEAVDYNYYYDPPAAAQPISGASAGPVSLTLDPSTASDPCSPVVGLIDTGLQSMGSQLDQFIVKSISVTGEPSAASVGPTHATSMAQTILRAVSQQTKSTSVKILAVDVYGSSGTATTWNVALGIKAAVDGGATVLNMSLGGTSDSTILDSIVKQALDKGVVIFAAAGNQPVDTATYPAAIAGVNAVTALGSPGQLAAYANYGSFVDMALPGNSVVYLGNQAYVVQGTSPATAYASGVAAGYKGINCDSWEQIQAAMKQKFTVPAK
jgi:thermitase